MWFSNHLTDLTLKNSWTTVIGNSIEYEYFTGTETDNPSGSTDNLKKEIYKDGDGNIAFAVNYSWNLADNIIKEVCVEN